MLEVADVLRLYGVAYRAQCGARLRPSHARAMRDLERCRTAYFGGHVAQCDHCAQQAYVYHSCRNRHCPKCHRDQTERWLEAQRARLLPCPYYLLTLTLPSELRALARAHQKLVYGLLMRCAAAAIHTLARDPRHLGASIGCLAVLHTWTRALRYHPHVHLLVTAGGLSADGTQWIAPKHPAYLVPVRALAVIFRAKVCAALTHAGLLPDVPVTLWKKPWVVHAQPAGRGHQVLEYLSRYVFRIAISNSCLERIEDGQVTFRYRDNRSHQLRRVTLPALAFLARFLQHVLPRGCTKVRYYGIWSSARRTDLVQARALLSAPVASGTAASMPVTAVLDLSARPPTPSPCPHCHVGHLIVIDVLRPQRKVPP
ncbi:MAG: IS91 family transposase [bacterium]